MNRPVTIAERPEQRVAIDLLAMGLQAEQVAKVTGIPVSSLKVWMKGSVFNLEIDQARDKLLGNRRAAFAKRLADELDANATFLASVRDAKDLKISDRLRAVELMLQYIAIPAGRKSNGDLVTTGATIKFGSDKEAAIRGVLSEKTVETTAKRITTSDEE